MATTFTREGLGLPTGFGSLTAGGGGGRILSGGGGGFGGGGLGGAAPRNYNPASGGIPGVTNPINTITGNLGGIGGISSAITDQQLADLRKQYPSEYFATLQQLLLNTQRRAGGDISDLLPELQTRNAEAGIAGGYSGSGMENTKLLRDLGLTRYGVEEQALKDLGLIQSGTPTVKPYDPTGIMSALVGAQERADIYAAAPVPEEAYKRARDAARGGGGGGGGGGPGGGVRPGTVGGGGGGGGTVDDILKRYGSGLGGGFGPPIIARGTRMGGLPDADYENPITFGPGGSYGSGQTSVEDFDQFAGQFGGGLGSTGFEDYEDYGGYDDYTDSPDSGDYGYEDYGGGGADEFYEEDYY